MRAKVAGNPQKPTLLTAILCEAHDKRHDDKRHDPTTQTRAVAYAMVGGLALSQLLTLFTTPVIYLYLDRLQNWISPRKPHSQLQEELPFPRCRRVTTQRPRLLRESCVNLSACGGLRSPL